MPAAWNDNFEDADWASVDFLNMFLVALWERELAVSPAWNAIAGAYETPWTADDLVVAGDDVQAAAFWSGLQLRAEQLVAGSDGQFFMDPEPTVEGHAFPWASGSASQEVGFALIEPASVFASLGMGGWMRKRPREISEQDQRGDDVGNAPEDGHRARLVSDGLIYQWSDSSEVWELSADQTSGPDLLIGEQGDERYFANLYVGQDTRGMGVIDGARGKYTVNSQVYQWMFSEDEGVMKWQQPEEPDPLPFIADRVPTGSGVIFGRVQPGDYLGPWVPSELRDFLNVLNRMYVSALILSSAAKYHSSTNPPGNPAGTFSTKSAAVAQLASNWPSASESVPGYANFPTFTEVSKTPSGSSTVWSAVGFASQFVCRVDTFAHRSRTATLYSGFKQGFTTTTSNVPTFDAQGSDAPASPSVHAWHSFGTLAIGTLATPNQTWNAGYSTSAPPSYGTPPGDPIFYAENGFELVETFAVVDWAFTYGPA